MVMKTTFITIVTGILDVCVYVCVCNYLYTQMFS